MEQEVTKPMCMELEEAKAQIVGVVNDCASRVPFYLLESIVAGIAQQVASLADREREAAKKRYEKQCKEKEGDGND
jgi:hypothetical protein